MSNRSKGRAPPKTGTRAVTACYLCESECEKWGEIHLRHVECPHCGKYDISHPAIEFLKDRPDLSPRVRAEVRRHKAGITVTATMLDVFDVGW